MSQPDDGQLYFDDKLKRCPFCGGKGIFKIRKNGTRIKYSVGCLNVTCLGYPGYGARQFDSEDEALKVWNTRYSLKGGKL